MMTIRPATESTQFVCLCDPRLNSEGFHVTSRAFAVGSFKLMNPFVRDPCHRRTPSTSLFPSLTSTPTVFLHLIKLVLLSPMHPNRFVPTPYSLLIGTLLDLSLLVDTPNNPPAPESVVPSAILVDDVP